MGYIIILYRSSEHWETGCSKPNQEDPAEIGILGESVVTVILSLCTQEWSRSATRQCVGSAGDGVKEKKAKKKKKGTEYHDDIMTESEVNLILAAPTLSSHF